jgi:hypothetical protein
MRHRKVLRKNIASWVGLIPTPLSKAGVGMDPSQNNKMGCETTENTRIQEASKVLTGENINIRLITTTTTTTTPTPTPTPTPPTTTPTTTPPTTTPTTTTTTTTTNRHLLLHL